MNDFGVRGYAIALAPDDPTTLSQGDYLQVTVTSNFGSNFKPGEDAVFTLSKLTA